MTTLTITQEDLDRFDAAKVEAAIDAVHGEMTDAEVVVAYNSYRKARMKMDVDRAILVERIRSAAAAIEGRSTCYIDGEGLAVVDDGQGSLFDA